MVFFFSFLNVPSIQYLFLPPDGGKGKGNKGQYMDAVAGKVSMAKGVVMSGRGKELLS